MILSKHASQHRVEAKVLAVAHKAPQLLASLPLSPGTNHTGLLAIPRKQACSHLRAFVITVSNGRILFPYIFSWYSPSPQTHLCIYYLSPPLECKLREDRNFAFFFSQLLYPQCLEKYQINEMDHHYRWIPTLGRMWRSITSKFPFSSQVLRFCIIVVKSRGLLILWTGWNICFTEGLWEIAISFIIPNS